MQSKHPEIGDAFGNMLWDAYCYEMNMDEIIETRSGDIWANYHGTAMYFAPYAQWSSHEKTAIAHMKGTVLDIGCGAGRHSLYAQSLGHDVTAIDSSWLATEVARLRGVKQKEWLSIERAEELGEGRFDTVLLLGNGLGLLGNHTKARRLLKMLYKSTTPGGIIIGESKDPEHIRKDLLGKATTRSKLQGQIRLRVRYRNMTTPWFNYCYLSPKELEEMIRGTGWVVREKIRGRKGVYVVVLAKK